MTPLGTTPDNDINFYVNTPHLYGSYRLWAENTVNYIGTYTGYQYLGQPYTGTSISGGVLSFTGQTAYDTVKNRLSTAYEAHQTLLDAYDSLGDDAANNQAIADGFNEFLPFEEFEAHFNFSSLREQIESEIDYWLSQPHEDDNMDDFPEDDYFAYSYEKQTLLSPSGEIWIGGGEYPYVFPVIAGSSNPANPGPNSCVYKADRKDKISLNSNRRLKVKLWIDDEPNKTTFGGQSITYKRWGFFWVRVLERQKVKISGNYYNSCIFESSFDSGYANDANHRRRSQKVDYPVGPTRATKSGELTVSALLNGYSGTPYTLSYTH